jgi:hypothetical protein
VAKHRFSIHGRVFETKTALEAAAKRIRNAQPPGVPLDRGSQAFIEEVFRQLYPKGEYERKRLGVGARAITVIEVMGGRCFRFLLNDGRSEEPSLRVCFQRALSDPASTARMAFRFEVFPDCAQYRDGHFARHGDSLGRAPCELTGKAVTVAECEIDHIPPDTFQAILDDYLAARGWSLKDIPTKDPPSGLGVVLADEAQARDWRAYHLARARLRVVDRQVHVEETKRQPKRSGDEIPELVLTEEELDAILTD